MHTGRPLILAAIAFVLAFPAGAASSPADVSAGPAPLSDAHALDPVDTAKAAEKPVAAPTERALPAGSGSGEPSPAGANLDVVRDRHGFAWPWSQGIQGGGVNVAVVEDGVDIAHPDLSGRQAVVNDPTSPYVGWPIAHDPVSMSRYLATNETAGTWFANTTESGQGPFEEQHTIVVDGTNDFGVTEQRGVPDTRDNTAGSPGGNKEDFDVTDLYATRDADNLYFGFSSYPGAHNVSFALLIDVDNDTAGSPTLPEGKLVDTNTAHADAVNDVAFSADGSRVATAGSDRVVRIWSTSGTLQHTLLGHQGVPMSVAWSPNGQVVASADSNSLRLWDANTGQSLQVFSPLGLIPENGVVEFSPNGTWVAVSRNLYIHFFDVATRTLFGTLRTTPTDVNSVRFSPNGSWIAATLDNTNGITVYNASTPNIRPGSMAPPLVEQATPYFALTGVHSAEVFDARWSTDGQRLVSGGRDNRVVVWDIVSRTPLWQSASHGSTVRAVDFSPTQAQIVSVSEGVPGSVTPTAKVWDAASGLELYPLDLTNAGNGVDWSTTGIVIGSSDMTAWIRTPILAPVRPLTVHKSDYVLMVRQTDGGVENAVMEIATLYTWNATTSAWDGAPLRGGPIAGDQASEVLGLQMFTEFAVPRSVLGDPLSLSLMLLSTGDNASRVQDTAPQDPNVAFKGLDFSPGTISVGAFTWYRHFQYSINGITSASNRFHFGNHPSPILQRRFGVVGILVVDSAVAGRYDEVIVDLNTDRVFDAADPRMSRASPTGALDNFDANPPGPGQDGYPDISAGMIYFIADGQKPLPYANVTIERANVTIGPNNGLTQRVPDNGTLVAFIGEFKYTALTDEKEDHGTKIASAILGQGALPIPVNGTAPEAKLVVIGNGEADPVEAWYFAVQGYDGLPGTGDEARVVLTPFNFPTTREDGYDAMARTMDYIAYGAGGGQALFVVSAGDFGFGYGTVASPAAAAAALAVGQAADYTDRSSLYGGTEGPNPQFGDVQMTSSRGPVALGVLKPELVAIGRGTLAVPLHAAADGSVATTASVPWSGTDLSAAIVAGAAALVYQAFKTHTGSFPNMTTAKTILMVSADDLHQDPFTQGSGFLNATRAVRLARGDSAAGILPDLAAWHPGGYRGTAHDAFTRLTFPGTSTAASLGVRNVGGTATTVTASDAVYRRVGGYALENTTAGDPLYAPSGDIIFWVNDTGVWKYDPVNDLIVPQALPVPGLWAQADLVKVTAYSPYGELINKIADTTFESNYSYHLKTYDWLSVNFPYPHPTHFLGGRDLNLLSETSHRSNLLEARVRSPAARLHDGLVVRLNVPDLSNSIVDQRWQFTVEFYQRQDWSWLSVTSSLFLSANGTAGATGAITATLTVPSNAAIGTYEGVILLADSTRGTTTTIPVIANVAGATAQVAFGGNLLTSDLYDNNRLYGGYDHRLSSGLVTRVLRPYLGDWRYFYFDIPTQGLFTSPSGFKMMTTLTWTTVPSDIDIQVYGRGAVDTGSDQYSTRYGPYTLKVLGKTEESDFPELTTATGMNEEALTWDMVAGLNVVALHGNILHGNANNETFGGSAGWLRLDTSLTRVTNDLAGEAEMLFMSSFNYPALSATAVGPASSQEFEDVEIAQDWAAYWSSYPFSESLARGSFTYIVQVEKALILEVAITGEGDAEDLDMGVFRNSLGADCVWDPALPDPLTEEPGYWTDCSLAEKDPAQIVPLHAYTADWIGDETEFAQDCQPGVGGMSCGGGVNVNYDADSDPNERVKWVSPLDGFYFIQVLGFTVVSSGPCDYVGTVPCGHFDLSIAITLATGKGYQIVEATAGPSQNLIVGTELGLPAFTPVDYHMSWDFPGDTANAGYGGAILLGTPNAPGILVLPVNVIIDTVPPQFDGASMSIDAENRRDDATDTVNDATPQFIFTAGDPSRGELRPLRFALSLDGKDVTARATIEARYATVAGRFGLWQVTLVYTPGALADGVHLISLTIEDVAGNTATTWLAFTVDTGAPFLVLDALPAVTTSASVDLTGRTAPGAWVTLGVDWIRADTQGRFSLPATLLPGTNRYRVTATDWFEVGATGTSIPGNPVTAETSVVRDNEAPVFDRAPYISGDALTRDSSATVVGDVRDPYSPSEDGDPRGVVVTVSGVRASVFADGSFTATVPLLEGTNALYVLATDPAGNTNSAVVQATRDTVPPTLTLDPHADRVETGSLSLTGSTDGAFVSVNGNLVTLGAGGTFASEVTLSPGMNLLEVRTWDQAGNEDIHRFGVLYAAPARVPGVSSWLLALLAAVALVGGFLGGLLFQRLRGPPAPPGPEAPPPSPPIAGEEAPPVVPTVPPTAPPTTEDRAARLEKAYRDGRITKATYERNLAQLEAAKPPEAPAGTESPSVAEDAPAVPETDPRLARLEKALQEGKISRQVYDENVKKIKGST